ncbi:hypothetical protein RI367_007911 [Sorochytrium milnesiophthora]
MQRLSRLLQPQAPLQPRDIYANGELPPSLLNHVTGHPITQYASNHVVTSKYSPLSFLPKNLFEQFRRLANLYFLLLVILQCFPDFYTLPPAVVALPIIIIVLITAGKDGFEDYKRHVTDNQINSRIVYALGGGNWRNVNYAGHHHHATKQPPKQRQPRRLFSSRATWLQQVAPHDAHDLDWQPTEWRHLRVGDFVWLQNNDFVPADIVVLATSEPDGLCYLETKNLDGETNLKIRHALPDTSFIDSPEDCANIKFVITAEPPNCNMYSFKGTLTLQDVGVDGVRLAEPLKMPVTLNEVLLRGCILRNTEWAIGCVVYTGTDTKLRMNAGETPSKRSIIERKMNLQIGVQFVLLAAMCVACAIVNTVWSSYYNSVGTPFMPLDDQNNPPSRVSLIAFWSSLLAFQNIVPISLYLTVELVKTLQAYFIYCDLNMYYPKLDMTCKPRSWNLSDDLGQVEYVFSDKTGTLTQNVMEFRRCSINGVVYGAPLLTSSHAPPRTFDSEDYTPPSKYASNTPTFYDTALMLDSLDVNDHALIIDLFWRCLAICHTVLVSKPDPGRPYDIKYKAQSPDEAALVDTAKDMGYAFTARQLSTLFIDVRGVEEQYTLLAVLEFNSTRKRMSIVARRPDNVIMLYCKGADTVIYERLHPGTNELVNDLTLKHLEIFANEGLRTLCLSYRQVPEAEFAEWSQVYNAACTSLHDRDTLIDAAAELIERDLTLIGATAIEDKLQDGVPESLQLLRDAGLKVWVLTGDKMETAISIGFSCNLLTHDMELFVIRESDDETESVEVQLRKALERRSMSATPAKSVKASGDMPAKRSNKHKVWPLTVATTKEYALVIDGFALKQALEGHTKDMLLRLGTMCKAVICCRVSPLQKAQVVQLVKHGRHAVTCAIGDGANDISMIQAAHIGVGIAGEEGLQAVMASDYAVAQFRYLARLLLVHGRWSYHRISELIFNFLFKDLVFVMATFWFQIYSGWSTEPQFEYTLMLLYNLFFTNWPVVVLSIFDRDVSAEMAERVPMLYQTGMRQTLFTNRRFAWYMCEGLWQSLVCFYLPYGIYLSSVAADANGYIPDRFEMGSAMAAAAITNANVFTALCVKSFTWMNHVAIWILSVGFLYAWIVVYSQFSGSPLLGYSSITLRTVPFWSSVVLSTVACQLPHVVIHYVQRNYYPTDVDIVQEYTKLRRDISPALPARARVQTPQTPPSALVYKRQDQSLSFPQLAPETPTKLHVTVRTPASIGDVSALPPSPILKTMQLNESQPARSPLSQPPMVPVATSLTSVATSASDTTQPSSSHPTAPADTQLHVSLPPVRPPRKHRGYTFSQDEGGAMRSLLMGELSDASQISLAAQIKYRRSLVDSDEAMHRANSMPSRAKELLAAANKVQAFTPSPSQAPSPRDTEPSDRAPSTGTGTGSGGSQRPGSRRRSPHSAPSRTRHPTATIAEASEEQQELQELNDKQGAGLTKRLSSTSF